MREFERAVGQTALVVRCDPSLSTQAEWLLRTVGKVLEATPFKEGMTIQVGWPRFSLRTQAGRVVVCEPAYRGNPFAASSTDVTVSLAVLAAHDELIQLLDVEPEPVSFHHSVLIRRGCLSEQRIVMERTSPAEGDASGWSVDLAEHDDDLASSDDRELIRSTELLRVRRPLVLPLFLPAGYVVSWTGDEIVTLRGPDGRDRWTTRAADVLVNAEKRLEAVWQAAGKGAAPS
jgi:hypothetical protein